MGYDYSKSILIQGSAGHLVDRELGLEVAFAYNTEHLSKTIPFAGQAATKSCSPIFLSHSPLAEPVVKSSQTSISAQPSP